MTDLEFLQIFADNLRSIMEEVGYNQEDLAFDAYTSQGTISKYLHADRMPNIKTLNNLCCALNCDIEELVPLYELID